MKTWVTMAFLFTIILTVSTLIVTKWRDNQASGYVYDCSTNQPIENVTVSLNDRGWGFAESGGLIWDKNYIYEAISDSNGFFLMNFTKNPTQILARKDGYLIAEQWEEPSSNMVIKMMRSEDYGYSNYCKLSTVCLQTTIENGVQVSKNICTSYD